MSNPRQSATAAVSPRMGDVPSTEPGSTAPRDIPAPRGKYLALLSLTALGIVYGDIGTSPLYAVRESFLPSHGLAVTPQNILGVLSLIFWSLILVISVKYLVFVLRADNRGEGGILGAGGALYADVRPAARRPLVADHAGAFRHGAPVRRRSDHPCYLGAQRGRRARGRDTVLRALHHPDHDRDSGRAVLGPAPRDRQSGGHVRAGDPPLVSDAGSPRHPPNRRGAGRAEGGQPCLRA